MMLLLFLVLLLHIIVGYGGDYHASGVVVLYELPYRASAAGSLKYVCCLTIP